MVFAPLFAAPLPVILHAFAAMTAFALGSVQLVAPKGTLPHRTIGWIWVLLMAAVAGSSFLIHTICSFGSFSIIHGLSLLTLMLLPLAVLHARNHRVTKHKRVMTLLFFGALVVAGFFTFWPGRIMHDIVFGETTHHGTCQIG
ncbi:DUF2306 domain-containing protein [Aquicoccus sp. G2-2]|uniref:DUF2306 domain-containing protein n=1 Tax=Aquicoccus sp. G2-2 TaxID=3092120 RepID=UPI002AE063C1|nr:DUF2306 domain-containing protein [Aquicoccus sp. G2-2]MEA1114866.1 DUF2306 domain-containing protein [Aquicoccus sp. G2-2]